MTTEIDGRLKENLSEFLLAGPWCNSKSETQCSEYLQYSWRDPAKMDTAQKLCYEKAEILINEIGQFLNFFNNVSLTNKQYKIIIGSWVHGFVELLHDREILCDKAKENGFSNAFVLNPKYTDIAKNPLEFQNKLNYSLFQYGIFSQVLSEKEMAVEELPEYVLHKADFNEIFKLNETNTIRRKISSTIRLAINKFALRAKVIVMNQILKDGLCFYNGFFSFIHVVNLGSYHYPQAYRKKNYFNRKT